MNLSRMAKKVIAVLVIILSGYTAVNAVSSGSSYAFHGIEFSSVVGFDSQNGLLVYTCFPYLKDGIMDENGKIIVNTDSGYGSIGEFSEGLAPVRDSVNDKWGFINTAGKLVIPCQFDHVNRFSEGLAMFETTSPDDPYDIKFGYVDNSGKIAIASDFTSASDFRNGIAYVTLDYSSAIIDKQGNYILGPTDEIYEYLGEGMFSTEDGDDYGLMNLAGKIVLKYNNWSLKDFSEGLASFYDHDKSLAGYIDKEGKTVIKPQFAYGDMFSDGMAAVEKPNPDEQEETLKCGYINTKGKLVIPYQYQYAGPFTDGMAVVEKGEKWGVIDKTGKVVLNFEYESIVSYPGGMFQVIKPGEKAHFISSEGKNGLASLPDEKTNGEAQKTADDTAESHLNIVNLLVLILFIIFLAIDLLQAVKKTNRKLVEKAGKKKVILGALAVILLVGITVLALNLRTTDQKTNKIDGKAVSEDVKAPEAPSSDEEIKSLIKTIRIASNDEVYYQSEDTPSEYSSMMNGTEWNMEVFKNSSSPEYIWLCFTKSDTSKDAPAHLIQLKTDKRGVLGEPVNEFSIIKRSNAFEFMTANGFTLYGSGEITFDRVKNPKDNSANLIDSSTYEKIASAVSDSYVKEDSSWDPHPFGTYKVYIRPTRTNNSFTQAVISDADGRLYMVDISISEDGGIRCGKMYDAEDFFDESDEEGNENEASLAEKIIATAYEKDFELNYEED